MVRPLEFSREGDEGLCPMVWASYFGVRSEKLDQIGPLCVMSEGYFVFRKV